VDSSIKFLLIESNLVNLEVEICVLRNSAEHGANLSKYIGVSRLRCDYLEDSFGSYKHPLYAVEVAGLFSCDLEEV
jgi:hypothetical protein